MLMSWNEVRARAAAFASNWRGPSYDKAETRSLYNDLFDVFGARCRSLARYEEHVAKLDDSYAYIDPLWLGAPNVKKS